MTSPKGIDAAELTVKVLRRASWMVVGGYGVALFYRFGLLRKIFSRATTDTIEGVVEKIKARTEPLGDARRYASARRHLMHVYTLSSMGMISAAVGGAAFFAFPKIPIIVPMGFTLVASTLVLVIPSDIMLYAGRVAFFLTSCFTFGYSFGPIGWVAWDSLAIFLTMLASTMAGLCVPLFLTRGMVSYVLSSQLLSCALSLAAMTTAPMVVDATFTNLDGCHKATIVDLLRRADVNVFLTMQLMSNCGINLLHTLPTIVYFVRGNSSEKDLLLSLDPLKESMCICAGAAYVIWRSCRWAFRRLILAFTADKSKADLGDTRDEKKKMFNFPFHARGISGLSASLMLALWYVRAVSALQRGETVATLESLRHLCARVSPVSVLMGCV